MENAIKPLIDSPMADPEVLQSAKEVSNFKPPTESSTSDSLTKEERPVLIREKAQPKRMQPDPMDIDDPNALSAEQLIFNVRDAAIKKLEGNPAHGGLNAALMQALSNAKDPQEIADVVSRDFQEMMKLGGTFGDLMQQRKHVMIMDDEADDLWLLLIMASKKILPAQVLTHGGHPYLRAHCAEYYLQKLALAFDIPDREIPPVHMGPPYLGAGASPYANEEGKGYVNPELRQKLIDQSNELKTEWQKMEQPWLHDEFKSSLDVMRQMLDDPNSKDSAFVVTTAPNILVNVLDENPDRAKKAIVTMSSPYYFNVDYPKSTAKWEPAFNTKGSATLPAFNKLLDHQVRFIGVGGGVSVSKGMREISDAAHGEDGAQIVGDRGIVGLEQIIHKDSKVECASVLAYAAENITKQKVTDWRKQLKELDDWVAAGKPRDVRPPRLARTNAEAVTNMRKTVNRYQNPVQIETAAADLYVTGLMPHEIQTTLQGAVSYGFKPTISLGRDGTTREALHTFSPSNDQVHFAVTDFNAFAMRNGVQSAVDHLGEITKTFTAQQKSQELERIAALKNQKIASALNTVA